MHFLKQHAYPSADHGVDFFSDVADYELFSVHNPLSGERSELKVSYVNKTFQKKLEHFCCRMFTLQTNFFFCQLLVLRKKTRRIKEARVIRALLIQMDSVALPITHVYFMQIW